jgi:phage-related baseplate assembly protein
MSNGTTLPLFGFDSTIVPDIDFCVKDASVIESDVIVNYENAFYAATKQLKTLARGDPVRLLLLTQVFQLVVQRSIVDSTGKENLLKYAHGDDLDNIAALYGPTRGARLQAASAAATLQFTLAAGLILTTDSIIPAGTLAQTNSGIQFATTISATIPAGLTSVNVAANCVQPGIIGNGFLAGQINTLVSWSAPFLVQVVNTDTSSGGADREEDDHYRARIWMAPESFSVAGPKEAYEYFAASANADIIDVSVWSDPSVAGQVYIYPLMTGGQLPTQQVLNEVYAKCNADDIRPLTDQVFVQAPAVVSATAIVEYWIDNAKAQFEQQLIDACQVAFADWITWQSSQIGLDIVPSRLIEMLIDAGAKRVVVTSPSFTIVDEKHLAVIAQPPTSVLTYGGLEEK